MLLFHTGAMRPHSLSFTRFSPAGGRPEMGIKSSKTKGPVLVLGRKIRDALSEVRLMVRAWIIQSKNKSKFRPETLHRWAPWFRNLLMDS